MNSEILELKIKQLQLQVIEISRKKGNLDKLEKQLCAKIQKLTSLQEEISQREISKESKTHGRNQKSDDFLNSIR